VVQRPADGGVTLVVGVDGMGLFDGIGAEQVVEGVPAGGVFDEQVRSGEFGQQLSRTRRR
jgi:hypothetical protein